VSLTLREAAFIIGPRSNFVRIESNFLAASVKLLILRYGHSRA